MEFLNNFFFSFENLEVQTFRFQWTPCDGSPLCSSPPAIFPLFASEQVVKCKIVYQTSRHRNLPCIHSHIRTDRQHVCMYVSSITTVDSSTARLDSPNNWSTTTTNANSMKTFELQCSLPGNAYLSANTSLDVVHSTCIISSLFILSTDVLGILRLKYGNNSRTVKLTSLSVQFNRKI